MTPDPLTTIIIDDEAHCRSALRKQLEWSCPHVRILADAATAEAGYQAIRTHTPDCIFLDIEMPDQNGFDLLRRFDDIDFEVVFTTAYDAFAIDAFRANAVDYLMKPIIEEDLIEAVDRVSILRRNKDLVQEIHPRPASIRPSNRKVGFPTAEGVQFVRVDTIIRAEAEGSYSTIYFGDGRTLFIAKTLKHIESLLEDPTFVRVHQSHLINTSKIDRYIKADGGSIVLEDESSVPLARSRKGQWRDWVG